MRAVFAGGLQYGADYNPEQWDAATVTQDIELMQQAQVNLVSLGIFSWALLEPEEGVYCFDYLLELMDKLHAAGIRVDLATGTASPPAWLAQRYPESLPVDAAGVRLGFGSRQQYAPCAPIVKEKMVGLARALAKAVKDHPALAMWHVGNEYGCHVAESFDPAAVKAFRSWLAARYRTIAALNEAWSTTFWSQRYQDFAQINPPAAMPAFPNLAQVVDWKRFSQEQLRNLYAAEVEVLREITPDVPVTTNFMGLFAPVDYWEWAQQVDVVADDSYPDPADPTAAAEVALTADLMRSLGGGKPFLLMEQVTGAVQWRAAGNSHKRPGQYELWSLSRIGHGASGILQFQWRQSRGGAEAMHSAMVPHAGVSNPLWANVVRLGEGLKRLTQAPAGAGSSFADTCCPAAQIGILLDWGNIWALQNWLGPAAFSGVEALRAWHRTCWEAGYLVDFVSLAPQSSPRDWTQGAYDILIVPEFLQLTAAAAQQLAAAAKAGTQVLVVSPTGIYDENLHIHLGGYLGPLREIAGVRVLDHQVATGKGYLPWQSAPDAAVDRITAAVGTPGAATVVEIEAGDGQVWLAQRWAEIVEICASDVQVEACFAPRGATVDLAGEIATWQGKAPALTRRPYGQGAVWYLATDLLSLGRAEVLNRLAAQAAVEPQVVRAWQEFAGAPLALPPGVEVLVRGPWLFVLNHADTPLKWPGPARKDLYSGREVSEIAARQGVVWQREGV